MTKERWADILGNILDNFEVLEHEQEHYDEEGGMDVETIIFKSPAGKMKLEFIEKPAVLGKKTTYSNRIGSETGVDYIYSDTEKSCHMEAYQADGDDWLEISANQFK